MEENELLKKYNGIYLEIIMKYKELIEEKEGLYVAELPKLIIPQDESVLLIAKNIRDKFPLYSHAENFYDAARLAYEYIRDEITTISLPIQFWQKPFETIKHSAGDIFDKVVLLCSLLIALEGFSSKAVIVVRENERAFVVYFEIKDKVVGIDVERGMKDYVSKEQLFKSLGIDEEEDVTAYEFNDKMYNDIA